jgi:hypothetical protein
MGKKKKATEHRALSDISYVDENENEVHIAAGDKVTDLPDNVVKSETKAGNLEPYRARHTENVRTADGCEVTGVESRHRDGQIVMREVRE